MTLAYPSFSRANSDIIGKDCFVKGLHPAMQLQLKSLEKFKDADVKTLVEEVSRLELAGVKSCQKKKTVTDSINSVQNEAECDSTANEDSINARLGRIETILTGFTEEAVNVVDGATNIPRSKNKTATKKNISSRKCQNCSSTEHMVRKCPSRFCQACGKKGHDAWEKQCPNYC